MDHITKKPEDAISLSPYYYTDKNHYEKTEKPLIFDNNNWYCIGLTNEFKNNIGYKAYDIPHSSKSVIITFEKGVFKAFYNSCAHRGTTLVDIEDQHMFVNKSTLVCPYHRWSYKLNGKIKNIPRADNNSEYCKSVKLQEVPIEIVNNLIFIKPQKHDKIETTFGKKIIGFYNKYTFREDCDIVYTNTYKVNCNWKLLVSNFCCYYHITSVHPTLSQVSGVDEHNIFNNDGYKYIHFNTDPLTINDETSIFNKMKPMNKHVNPMSAEFIVFFPNVFMFLLCDHAFYVIVEPVSASESIERTFLLLDKKRCSDKKYVNELISFYNITNDEDINVCIKNQKGLYNNVKPGKYILPYERCVYEFNKIYFKTVNKKNGRYSTL